VDLSGDFEPVYAHHDLLIEMGRIELAMDDLHEHAGGEDARALASRMQHLREALAQLPA